MKKDEQRHDPFADFINTSLDMDGIEGMDQALVAEKVQRILHNLPTELTPDLWNDQLDSLQAVIRVCLDLKTVLASFGDQLDPDRFSHDDLETLVMLSVTFAFVSYNELRPAYTADDAQSDNTLLARRLRETLQVTLGWVKHAARQGDPVASRLVEEVTALLNSSSHLE